MIEIKLSYDRDPAQALESTRFLGFTFTHAGTEAQSRLS